MATLTDLLSFLQGASNSAAATVSAPVDGINWLLKKAGVPVSDKPVGGSDWLKDKGLMAEPQNPLAGYIGEAVGGVTPMLTGAYAPQIASRLVQMGENVRAPAKLGKEAGVLLFHGTDSMKPLKKIEDSGLFGGIFTSQNQKAALSHGANLYRMTIPDAKVMSSYDDVPWDDAVKTVKDSLGGNPLSDDIADMALSNKDVWGMADDEVKPILDALGTSDLGEASWELQRLRGLIAKQAGFKAVSMPDEHGVSYLVLPGTSPRPYNEKAKQLARGLLDK